MSEGGNKVPTVAGQSRRVGGRADVSPPVAQQSWHVAVAWIDLNPDNMAVNKE